MIKEEDRQRFVSRYEEQVKELLVLTSENVGIIADCLGHWLYSPSAGLLAWIDQADGQLQKSGNLHWLADESMPPDWGFGLRKLTIYRVRARALKEWLSAAGPEPGAFFMPLEVLETLETEPQLEPIRQAYLTPVILTDTAFPGVEFALDRRFDWFCATLDWLGKPCRVSLDTDDYGSETAQIALDDFKRIYADLPDWDAKLRAFAAEEMTEYAYTLQAIAAEDDEQDYQKLINADFAQLISIRKFYMISNGYFIAYYDDANLFDDCLIRVEGNIESGVYNAEVE